MLNLSDYQFPFPLEAARAVQDVQRREVNRGERHEEQEGSPAVCIQVKSPPSRPRGGRLLRLGAGGGGEKEFIYCQVYEVSDNMTEL